jgi:hypothetical protein
MAKGWKCARCSTLNGEAAINCSNCRLIRGGVVAAGLYTASPVVPTVAVGEAAEAPADVQQSGAASVKTPLWRRIPIGWLVTGVIVVGGGLAGLYFNASRGATGEIIKAGDLSAIDLRIGDCFDLKDPAADEVDDVTARLCTDEHEFEVIFVGSMPDVEYPADDEFEAFVADNCGPAFDAYVGKVYEESELDIYWFFPNGEGWADGDRSIQCAAFHPRIHRLTESIRGSNQ